MRAFSAGRHSLASAPVGPFLLLALSLSVACGSDSLGPDHQRPTVSISAPAPGPVSGHTIIQTQAHDNRAVVKVEFRVNGGLVATVTVSPFTYDWDTDLYAAGTYEWTVRAYDAAGLYGDSAPVDYTVGP
jgi:Bacterial Ig domain